MLFNSLHYLCFLPAVVGLYYLVPARIRWMLLLCASYYFYMCWRPEYALLLVTSTVVDYLAGLSLEQSRNAWLRRFLLVASLTVNLGLLFAFKYLNFFGESANLLFGALRIPISIPTLDVLLPVGISFYTFQTISYTIDVYRRRRRAERHLGIFALYVSFFPQLVAGPIERSEHLLPQFHRRIRFSHRDIENGVKLILWGLFKKVVIADRLACFVDAIYADPSAYHGAALALATYFFAFQIYCDFSGYSDVAIGSAQLLGINLRLNFRRPYFSRNIREFWGRWHVSLSTWFRDYVYIPLGGNRVSALRWVFNIMAVFLLSGLWHGAAWTFVVWGGIHGLLLVCHRLYDGLRRYLPAPAQTTWNRWFADAASVFITFHVVLVAWIFFGASSIADAVRILTEVISLSWVSGASLDAILIEGFGKVQLAIALVSVLMLLLIEWRGEDDVRRLPRWSWRPVRWAFYYGVLLAIVNFGMFHNPRQFIYFQF